MNVIDDLAYGSHLRHWPPLGKLLLSFSLLVVNLFARSPFVPLIILLIGLGLMLLSTRGRIPLMLLFIILDGIMLVVIGVIIIAFIEPGAEIWSGSIFLIEADLGWAGVNKAILILVRSLAGMILMLSFAVSTPIPHIFIALRQLRIPAELAELTVLVYRYTFLLLEMLARMHVAAASRLGFNGYRTSLRTTSRIVVGVFINSLDQAERSQIALDCRNFQGEFHTFHRPESAGISWAIGPLALAASMYTITIYTEGWMIMKG
jgi:cobalt/nickel transport system permease protein